MLLPEDRLELLLDRLRAMSVRDQRAILRHLSAEERKLLARAQDRPVAAPAPTPSEFSAQVAARVAQAHAPTGAAGLTAAATAALARLTPDHARAPRPQTPRGASLASSLGNLIRGGAAQ